MYLTHEGGLLIMDRVSGANREERAVLLKLPLYFK